MGHPVNNSSADVAGAVSPLRILALVVTSWRTVVVLVATSVLVAVLPALVGDRSYSSRTVVVPDVQGGAAGGVGALAMRLGVALPLGGADRSLQFFAALARSDAAFRSVVSSKYPSAGGVTLADLWEVEGDSDAERMERAAKLLRGFVRVSTDVESNSMRVEATAGSPELARTILQNLMHVVDSLNRASRQRQASSERAYLETRYAAVKRELEVAEALVASFVTRNRRIDDSPELRVELDRLQRDVNAKQSVLVAIAQSVEQARASELRDAPSLVPVEPPTEPALPDRRFIVIRALLGMSFGLIVSIVVLLMREQWRSWTVTDAANWSILRDALARLGARSS